MKVRADWIVDDLPRPLWNVGRRDELTVELALETLASGQPDLMAVYMKLPDRLGHTHWRQHSPYGLGHRFDDQTGREVGLDTIENGYIIIDRLLARLLVGVDRDRTSVIVVSDHSTDAPDPLTARRFAVNHLVYRFTKQRAYVPFDGGWLVHHLYLRMAGRESRGVVAPEQFETIAAEIQRDLLAIRTVAGERFFDAVEITGPTTVGDRQAQPADLVAIVNGSLDDGDAVQLPDETVLNLDRIISRFDDRTGTHSRNGIIVLSGPGIRRGLVRAASILDVAPTILALLGMPMAADQPGRWLAEALDEGIAPACFVPTFDHLVGQDGENGSARDVLSLDERRQLEALGYVQ